MRLVLVESYPEAQAALLGRVQEASRQADLRRVHLVEANLSELPHFDWSDCIGCLIGPACLDGLEETVGLIRVSQLNGPIGIIIENEIYAQQAVTLRRRLNTHVIAVDDMAQIAGFLIDAESRAVTGAGGVRNKGVIGVAQLKGGVGTTTITAALASCWARHGLSVAAIDLDDLNPQLTAWARVGPTQRTVTSELLRQGEVPASRINELVFPVEGFEGRLVVVGQPDAYNESFHFKANVLDGAPSCSEFLKSLVENLRAEFDAVIVDLGKSWGVGTFSCLPLCQQVVLVTDDDGMSVRRTLDVLQRLRRESDDSEEFDFSKWSLILNGYTGRLISPKDIATEIQEMELFPSDASLFTLPFSESGRQWGAPGQSLYDLADDKTKEVIRKIASHLVPFRYEERTSTISGKLLKRWQTLTGAA